jgi:hypothetical protein
LLDYPHRDNVFVFSDYEDGLDYDEDYDGEYSDLGEYEIPAIVEQFLNRINEGQEGVEPPPAPSTVSYQLPTFITLL